MSNLHYSTTKHTFPERNVLGLKGRVFGRHWHQRTGVNVPTHPDFCHDVRIVWRKYNPLEAIFEDGPAILPHAASFFMFDTKLAPIEDISAFPIREHCRGLVARNPAVRPVILEWGCGAGNAVKELTADPQIRGRALVFGYGDTWDVCWNEVMGVKFLFFIKEHLAEYFRRARLKIDFIFTHGGLETMLGEEERSKHLRDLASVMPRGGIIAFPMISRLDIPALEDLFTIEPCRGSGEFGSCIMIRK